MDELITMILSMTDKEFAEFIDLVYQEQLLQAS